MNTAKLVSVTHPTQDLVSEGITSAEELISYCARVSNPSNQLNTETAPKLLKYLINHKHWSPFEMASMTVEITTSRAIAAQILRHRSFSFQEFSQRYSTATRITDIELRKQADKNRQSSTDEFDPILKHSFFGENVSASRHIDFALEKIEQLYTQLIEAGVARECARSVLPLATETTMYMTGTIRSWIHYIDLRAAEDTQKEHRDIAVAIKDIFKQQFPNISEALWKQ